MTQEPAKGIAEWQDIEFWKIVADAAYEDAAFEIKRANDAAREVLRLTAALEAETANRIEWERHATERLEELSAVRSRLAIAEKLARTPGLGEICTICGVYSEPDKKLAKDFVCRAWLPSSKSLCPLRTAVAAEGGES